MKKEGNKIVATGDHDKQFIEKAKTINVNRRHFLKFAAAVSSAAAVGSAFNAFGAPKAPKSAGAAGAGGAAGIVIKKGEPMVAMFTSMDNPYYYFWGMGAEQAVKALDMKYEVYLSEGLPERQISQMETKAAQGCKMFFITAPEESNIQTIAHMASKEKFYWTNTWEQPKWWTVWDANDYYVSYFIPPSLDAGYLTAKNLFTKMGGKGGFLQVSGWPGATSDWQRTAGMQKAMKEFPGVKLLDSKPGKWNRIDSRKATEDMVVRFPDVKGVFAQNDDIAIGAMNVLEERGIKVPCVGVDGNKETLELIKQGRIAGSISSFPPWQAGYSAVRVYDAFCGWKPTAAERMMFTGHIVIDESNVDACYKKFYTKPAPDVLPFDWRLMSRVLHPDDWDPQNLVFPIDVMKYWEGGPIPKPKGFKMPEAVKASIASGEWARVTKMYADHYKRKIL